MINITRFTNSDSAELAEFLASEPWPYHVNPTVTKQQVYSQVADGLWAKETTQSYWIDRGAGHVVGIIKVFDLSPDETPLFDIRITAGFRGQGIGTATIGLASRLIFQDFSTITRIEATSRHDNVPMRRALVRNGFVKEAHYRQAWPSSDGLLLDSVGYALLRSDWKNGTVTPVPWSD